MKKAEANRKEAERKKAVANRKKAERKAAIAAAAAATKAKENDGNNEFKNARGYLSRSSSMASQRSVREIVKKFNNLASKAAEARNKAARRGQIS